MRNPSELENHEKSLPQRPRSDRELISVAGFLAQFCKMCFRVQAFVGPYDVLSRWPFLEAALVSHCRHMPSQR